MRNAGFRPTHKPTRKNQKSCFLPTLENNEQIMENRNRIEYKKVYLKAQVKKD